MNFTREDQINPATAEAIKVCKALQVSGSARLVRSDLSATYWLVQAKEEAGFYARQYYLGKETGRSKRVRNIGDLHNWLVILAGFGWSLQDVS